MARVPTAKKALATGDNYRSQEQLPKGSKPRHLLGQSVAHSRASSRISRKEEQLSAARALKGNRALKNAVSEFRKERANRYSRKQDVGQKSSLVDDLVAVKQGLEYIEPPQAEVRAAKESEYTVQQFYRDLRKQRGPSTAGSQIS